MELINEILSALRANRLRTALTGFAIVWGIFMLIILLSAGNGLNNGMSSNFFYMAKNTIALYPGTTTLPYGGFQKGRALRFSPADVDFIEEELHKMADIQQFTPIYNAWNDTIVYGKEFTVCTLSGVRPGYEVMRSLSIADGRFLNQADEVQRNKVILLHTKTADILFGEKKAVGSFVNVNGLPFKVVGVYTEKSESWRPSVYIPFATSQVIYNPKGNITDISFSVGDITTKEQSDEFAKKIRTMLAHRLNFDPNDEEAVWIRDSVANAMQSEAIFAGISFFIWIIGIGTLVAGIVGVGNIMLITVKERTKEFGIRKALGASPYSILKSVILESLIITITFGYIGLFLGILVSEGVAKVLEMMPKKEGPTMFMNPTVDLPIALAALAILVIAGTLAGYIPARKAVNIKPIEALQAK